jgi:DNA-binding LytR/AlgR family response regulator
MKRTIEDAAILIVEDDRDYTLLLSLLLEQLSFKNILYAVNYDDALDKLETETVDLLLIDIDLGKGKNGIMLAEEIRRRQLSAPLIYVTSNHTDDYYDYARHTRPSSFMSKELSRLKLYQAIDISLAPYFDPEAAAALRDTSVSHVPHIQHHNLYFKVGDEFKTIPVDQTAYFYADQKISYAKVDNRNYPTSIQLKTLQDELLELGFMRIHKSYLVNTRLIETINPDKATVIVNGETLPIGSAYRKSFLSALKLLS